MKCPESAAKPIFISFTMLLFAFTMVSCGKTFQTHTERITERFHKTLKVYNNQFESHAETGGATYVKPEFRPSYTLDVDEIRQKVTFKNSTILSITFLNDGTPVKQNADGPAEAHNEVKVVMRYQFILSPSASLRTRVVNQKWVRINQDWFLEPDLKPFLN